MYNDFHNPPISPLPKHSLYDSYSPRNSSYSTTSISNTTDNGNSNNKVKSKSSNSKMSTIRNFLKKKECMICIEKRYIKSFVIISKNCNHDTNICDECVKKYIESNLNDKGDVNIKCPFAGCHVILDSYEIKSLVKKDLYERYDKLALRKALQQMSDIRWCKNPKCGSAQSHIGSDSEPILTCGDCGTKSCFTHDSLWHEGLTCQQYDEVEKARNEATHTYLEQHTKPCPKCGVRISKNEGCDHMTCKVLECKHEFCWLCLADYANIRDHGNHYHETGCSHYRAIEKVFY
ncbi:197_t:CDS:2 [Entrophospora sp. SA101]|nr:15663_t:CDS:2 [Entrophospora sp. SA101]CAJ0757214.1 197_t:CDS:2 [Entrophospora sp. SA101]